MPAGGKKLQVGEIVGLEETNAGCRLTVLDGGQPGHQVLAVEPEYVLLADVMAGVTMRIPMYLVDVVLPEVRRAPTAAAGEPPALSTTPPGEAA